MRICVADSHPSLVAINLLIMICRDFLIYKQETLPRTLQLTVSPQIRFSFLQQTAAKKFEEENKDWNKSEENFFPVLPFSDGIEILKKEIQSSTLFASRFFLVFCCSYVSYHHPAIILFVLCAALYKKPEIEVASHVRESRAETAAQWTCSPL